MYREQTWQYGHGKVGYLEGDLAFLSLRQFRALPATPAALERALRREAMQTWSARHPGGGGATADQLIWDEALQVLQDPVAQPVRAAAFRVMAHLPDVRMLGRMRDPLGQVGYGVGTGPTTLGQIAIIDPAAGSLLAYEYMSGPPGAAGVKEPVIRRGGKRVQIAPPWVGRPDVSGPNMITCLLVTGWTNSQPPFARAARHFDALAGY
jgi:hypothetical protein